MSNKYNQMCIVVALGNLTCAIYLIAVRAKFLGNKISLAEWDLNIVTVDDYSVQL